MILLDSKLVRDFIELKIKYADTKFEKIVRKYDDSSGDSLLEPIIFYKISEYDIFVKSIEKLYTNNDIEELEKYLMVARGIVINSVQLEEEKYINKLFKLFMDMNGLYNYLQNGKRKKMEDIKSSIITIINDINTLQASI